MNHKYAIALLLMFVLVWPIHGQQKATPAAPASNQKTFSSPQEAANALINAAEAWNVPALELILGPEGDKIIHSGEPAYDRENTQKFAALARTNLDIAIDPTTKRRAVISVGENEWPFPVPLVKTGTTWSFDSKAGLNEILLRRIGRNELDTIELLRGFNEAQDEYAETRHAGQQVNQYAQKVISTPGTQDGLAWRNPDGTWDGPIGENVARAIERGYSSGQPYHGYYFKILKGQGPDAPLGQMDYVINGAMIGGFAILAFPAQYRNTGVMSFIISNDGVVYQKDLGPNTTDVAKSISRFNPDKTWTPVAEQTE
jgi:Protein of unknown function (DUF2950)